jgi:hypothetical protein
MNIMTIKHVVALLAASFWAGASMAQQSVHTAGGDGTGSGGSVAFSVGQVFYNAEDGNNGSLAQGVQHAYEIVALEVEGTAIVQTIALYPVPALDQLSIQLSEYSNEDWSYRLLDAKGNLIRTEKITSNQTLISMGELAAGSYIVHVIQNQKNKIQSFKIIKQ